MAHYPWNYKKNDFSRSNYHRSSSFDTCNWSRDFSRSNYHRSSSFDTCNWSRGASLRHNTGYDGTVLVHAALHGPCGDLTSDYGYFDRNPHRKLEVTKCHATVRSSHHHLISGRVDYSPSSPKPAKIEKRGEPVPDTVTLSKKELKKHEPVDVKIRQSDENDLNIHRRLCSCHNNNQQVPISRFKLKPFQFLPPSYKHDDVVDFILALAATVVQVSVRSVSPNRPEAFWDSGPFFPRYSDLRTNALRVGSGMLSHVDLYPKPYTSFSGTPSPKCDCVTCYSTDSKENTFASIYIYTSAVLVYDDFEAQNTTVNFFFDTDQTPHDCPGVESLGGLRVKKLKLKEDRSLLKYSTHEPAELKLAQTLDILCKQRDDRCKALKTLEDNDNDNEVEMKNKPVVIMVSHPHGCSKAISFGHRSPSCGSDTFIHTAPSCPGSSGAPLVCDKGFCDFSISALHSGSMRDVNQGFSLSTEPVL